MEKNEAIFTQYKGLYPAFEEVFLERGTLIFPSNLEINLKDIDLSSIPEENYQMNATNFYVYISNRFYIHNIEEYEQTIDDILNKFTQLNLSENDITALQKFAYDFWLRLHLFTNEACLAKDEDFTVELLRRRSVITASLQSPAPAAQIITNIYNQNLRNSFDNNTYPENDSDEMNANKSQQKGISLMRNKPGLPPTIESIDESKLGIAGFTSVILVIALTIAFGIYLATNLFTQ